jgi:hypothetical protein
MSPAERQNALAQADDYASFLGLTRRAQTFSVPTSAVVDSPVHRDFAVFVRP